MDAGETRKRSANTSTIGPSGRSPSAAASATRIRRSVAVPSPNAMSRIRSASFPPSPLLVFGVGAGGLASLRALQALARDAEPDQRAEHFLFRAAAEASV